MMFLIRLYEGSIGSMCIKIGTAISPLSRTLKLAFFAVRVLSLSLIPTHMGRSEKGGSRCAPSPRFDSYIYIRGVFRKFVQFAV